MPLARLARALPVASLLLVLPLAGCTRHGANGLLFAIRVVELVAVVAASAPPPPQEVVVRHEVVVTPPPAPSTPSAVTRVPVAARTAPAVDVNDDRPAFDPMSARSALRSVDLSACRARELPRGHGHAIVTFAPSGAVSEILIDAPAGLSPRAVACVAESYRTANLSAFAGTTSVEVGTTWFAP